MNIAITSAIKELFEDMAQWPRHAHSWRAFHGRRTVLHYARLAQSMSTLPAQHPTPAFAAAKHGALLLGAHLKNVYAEEAA